MLAGEPPFSGKNAMAVMSRHAMETVPSVRIVRQAVPEEVEAAIFAGMGKVPADRPRSAREFAEIMGMPTSTASFLRVSGPTGTRRVPTGAYMRTSPLPVAVIRPWWKKPPAYVAMGVVVLVAGGALLVIKP